MSVGTDRYRPTFHISVGAFAYVMQRCIVEEALPIQNAVSDHVVHQRMITVDRVLIFSACFAHLVVGPIEWADAAHWDNRAFKQTCAATAECASQSSEIQHDGAVNLSIEPSCFSNTDLTDASTSAQQTMMASRAAMTFIRRFRTLFRVLTSRLLQGPVAWAIA